MLFIAKTEMQDNSCPKWFNESRTNNSVDEVKRSFLTGQPTYENEFVFMVKEKYFGGRMKTLMAHLPYFSNCRGFGRTAPFWTLFEQGRNCVWDDFPTVVGAMSIGAQAKGDKCSMYTLTCLLDEVPNSKLSRPRWFEAGTGSVLFNMYKLPVDMDEYIALKDSAIPFSPDDVVPVTIQQGGSMGGEMPGRILLVFQYYQFSDKLCSY